MCPGGRCWCVLHVEVLKMQACPAGVGGCKWHKEVHWLICMRTKVHTRITYVHMYGWLELCAHQLCVNIFPQGRVRMRMWDLGWLVFL